MRRKLRTKRGRERYALRVETVEPVFGQIKQGRDFRQFLLRGLAKPESTDRRREDSGRWVRKLQT